MVYTQPAFVFFTIYGPWGKPDMAMYIFTRKTINGEAIQVFTYGNMKRDFTYIDECVESVMRLMKSGFMGSVNIGSNDMVSINQFAEMAMLIAGKNLSIKHVLGSLGVRDRNSDKSKCRF